jgi:hypothetical protein
VKGRAAIRNTLNRCRQPRLATLSKVTSIAATISTDPLRETQFASTAGFTSTVSLGSHHLTSFIREFLNEAKNPTRSSRHGHEDATYMRMPPNCQRKASTVYAQFAGEQSADCCQLSIVQSASDGEAGFVDVAMAE